MIVYKYFFVLSTFHLVLGAGSLLPVRVQAQVISHGSRDEDKVALTFDACATYRPSHYDSAITEILIQTQTPATFFLGGRWVKDHPGPTKELAANPLFEIGNHSWDHPHLTKLDTAKIRAEIVKTQQAIKKITNTGPKYFRPPYGEWDDRVIQIVESLGMKMVDFDLASGDPDSSITRERLIRTLVKKVQKGSIIVFHINGRGWHTREALPEIIRQLRGKGLRLARISELNFQDAK